jgi:hypothetical protein
MEVRAMLARMRLQEWMYLALISIGVLVAIYYIVDGHAMNGVLVLGGILIGTFVLFGSRVDAPVAASSNPAAGRTDRRMMGREGSSERIWLRSGVIAGFAATIVMSIFLVFGYLIAEGFADDGGSTLGNWFYGLTHNQLTDETFELPLAAYSTNLLAGVIWALIYAAFFERRLAGPGWWRGVQFSLLPWILSLVVFFPVLDAGFFGSELGAGPLPAIGNLILHLAYGATLGLLYAWARSGAPDPAGANPLLGGWIDQGLAIGLAGGLMFGMIAGALAGLVIDSGSYSSTEIILAGAVSGVFGGAIVGPLVGLEIGSSAGMPRVG